MFCYYTSNNQRKLINQKNEENTALITTRILTTICIYIKLTKFLKIKSLKIEYDACNVIYEMCLNLDWCNNYKKEFSKKFLTKMTIKKIKNKNQEKLRQRKSRSSIMQKRRKFPDKQSKKFRTIMPLLDMFPVFLKFPKLHFLI